MNKKKFVKLIKWRKPFYKRIFCKHKWQGYNARGLTSGEYHTDICTKCGEIKYKQAIENIDNIMSFLFIEGDEKE